MRRLKVSKRWLFLGLVIISLIAVGLIIFSVADSSDRIVEPQTPKVQDFTEHRLVRIPAEGAGWLGGVLAGFAYYLAIPLWLLRLLFVVAVLWWDDSEWLIIIYILLWIFMPSIDFIPADFIARTG